MSDGGQRRSDASETPNFGLEAMTNSRQAKSEDFGGRHWMISLVILSSGV
jgi:hypothetical protein